MKVTYMCLSENESRGIGVRFRWKKGVIVWTPKTMGSFLLQTPQNGGHSGCKIEVSSQNLQILC